MLEITNCELDNSYRKQVYECFIENKMKLENNPYFIENQLAKDIDNEIINELKKK